MSSPRKEFSYQTEENMPLTQPVYFAYWESLILIKTAEVWSPVDVVLISKKCKFKASEMAQVGLVAKPDNLGSVPGT